MLGQDLS